MDKQKILIVDDSEMNRALLIDILEEHYDVVEAENGVEAISLLSKQRADFSLLLLDIMMPEMDGFEVLAYINKYHWNDTFAVIMISADDTPANIKRAYDLGAFDYISRPFDSTIVQRRISNTMFLYARQQRLEKIIAEQFHEQEKNSKLMISILSHIVEFRNGESGLHILHVNTITKYLLKQLVQLTDQYPLSKADISLISTASALHDIGKISISDAILNKPSRLTAEEFEVIKTHSVIGANMLLDLSIEQRENPLIKVASEICRWHHERYDGNGYPDGLKGEEIPIAAQVVALVDVYDALISERCYKKAYSHGEALKMILEGQCGAFNPTLLLCLQEIAETLESELMDTSSEQETKSIQDIRNEIDYGRLFSYEKHTVLSHKQEQLRLLYIDSLTSIYNRRYYDEHFQGADGSMSTGLVAAVPLEYIIDFLSLENEEQLIYYHIIRPDGSFVIQNDNTELWYFFEQLQKQLNATANELSVENSIKEFGAALKNHDEYSTTFEVNGETLQIYGNPLPCSEWYLVSVMPYSILNKNVDALENLRIFMVGLACASILIFLSLIFIRYIRKGF